jgi:hemerythrin-like metal-binding protein
MSALQVTPPSQTGHMDIDKQVRTLFAIANQILFSKQLEESPNQFRSALRFFVAYLDYHFASQEVAMAKSRYPAGRIHSDFHAYVLHEASAIRERARTEGIPVETRHTLLYLVEDWLYYHVKESDREFAEFLRETPAKQDVPRLPEISDLRASGWLPRDSDEQVLKQLTNLGHAGGSPWIFEPNEASSRPEHEDATGA